MAHIGGTSSLQVADLAKYENKEEQILTNPNKISQSIMKNLLKVIAKCLAIWSMTYHSIINAASLRPYYISINQFAIWEKQRVI